MLGLLRLSQEASLLSVTCHLGKYLLNTHRVPGDPGDTVVARTDNTPCCQGTDLYSRKNTDERKKTTTLCARCVLSIKLKKMKLVRKVLNKNTSRRQGNATAKAKSQQSPPSRGQRGEGLFAGWGWQGPHEETTQAPRRHFAHGSHLTTAVPVTVTGPTGQTPPRSLVRNTPRWRHNQRRWILKGRETTIFLKNKQEQTHSPICN